MIQSSHVYHFIPGIPPSKPSILLFHGSGGGERDLVPLAAGLAPGSSILGIRGTVEIDGGFAFFHRNADRSIDEADLEARISVLSEFIEAVCVHHRLANPPVAIGFSNGAITVAALLLTRPTLFAAAVLFRPLSPFLDDRPAVLTGKSVLIIDGAKDSRRSPGDGAKLAQRLSRAGANVIHQVLPVGHAITTTDEEIARVWLRDPR
jgi:phospholipase/carboxylesterase